MANCNRKIIVNLTLTTLYVYVHCITINLLADLSMHWFLIIPTITALLTNLRTGTRSRSGQNLHGNVVLLHTALIATPAPESACLVDLNNDQNVADENCKIGNEFE